MNQRSLLQMILLAVIMLVASDIFAFAADETASAEDDVETISADDIITSDDTKTDNQTSAIVQEGEFDVIDVLGADLACSACELTLDTLVKKFASAENAVRSELEKEAERKLKEKEEEKKDGDEDEDKLKEKDEDEKEDTDEDNKDKDNNDKDKKKKDKKKKDKKKKKKNDKKKKKPEVKVDKKVVAETVVEKGCVASDFDGVKTIGSYPGRRYDSYAGYGSKKKSKSKDHSNLAKACNSFVADHHDWIKQKLASPSSTDYKGMKKMKKSFCEKKHKMCKSAALGFEAESSCLAKSLRAVVSGEFDKASKLASKCPQVKSA